jgi:hypothetical protein
MADQNGESGGTQAGGGPTQSDMAAPGGSSGTGGYGKDQQSANHQGQQVAGGGGHDMNQSRGERFDEEQGGGRGAGSVSDDAVAQVGGSDGSFDQHTDNNPLTAAADALLRGDSEQQDGEQGSEFESDAQS